MLTIDPNFYQLNMPDGYTYGYSFLKKHERVFQLYFSRKLLKTDTRLRTSCQSLVGLYFNLGNPFECVWPGAHSGNITFAGNQFTLLYLPNGYKDNCIAGGDHQSVLLNINPALLQHMAKFFSIEPLLQSMEHKKPYVFGQLPLCIESPLARELDKLLKAAATHSDLADMVLFGACHLVMLECLEQISRVTKEVNTSVSGLERQPPPAITEGNENILHKTKEFLKSNLARKVSLGELADEAGTTVRTLTRLFRKRYGKTVMSWLFDERMKEARQLIVTTHMSILQIAHKVGYTQQTHFAKAFKTKWGHSPLQIRKAGM